MQPTCTEYRHEMILLGLKKQLADPGIDDAQKEKLEERIRQVEKELGMD